MLTFYSFFRALGQESSQPHRLGTEHRAKDLFLLEERERGSACNTESFTFPQKIRQNRTAVFHRREIRFKCDEHYFLSFHVDEKNVRSEKLKRCYKIRRGSVGAEESFIIKKYQ